MPKSNVFYCVEGVLESKIDEEIIIMNLQDGFYYGLDEIASRVWELLKERSLSLENLCSILQDEFDVDNETCQRETLIFLQSLKEQGLVNEIVDV